MSAPHLFFFSVIVWSPKHHMTHHMTMCNVHLQSYINQRSSVCSWIEFQALDHFLKPSLILCEAILIFSAITSYSPFFKRNNKWSAFVSLENCLSYFGSQTIWEYCFLFPSFSVLCLSVCSLGCLCHVTAGLFGLTSLSFMLLNWQHK